MRLEVRYATRYITPMYEDRAISDHTTNVLRSSPKSILWLMRSATRIAIRVVMVSRQMLATTAIHLDQRVSVLVRSANDLPAGSPSADVAITMTIPTTVIRSRGIHARAAALVVIATDKNAMPKNRSLELEVRLVTCRLGIGHEKHCDIGRDSAAHARDAEPPSPWPLPLPQSRSHRSQ